MTLEPGLTAAMEEANRNIRQRGADQALRVERAQRERAEMLSRHGQALRASLRVSQGIVSVADLWRENRLSSDNARITAEEMRRDIAALTAFMNEIEKMPDYRP